MYYLHESTKYLLTLREKCPNMEEFLSGPFFPRIRTEYGETRSISPYSVRMRENTDQKKLLRIWTLFRQCKVKKTQNLTDYLAFFIGSE